MTEADRTSKILIVEDEEDVKSLLNAVLSTRPEYELFFAGDGEETLTIARQERPNLVLLDVVLPKKDGFTVCRLLKTDPSTAHIKVAILSALTQEDEMQRGREAGADDYLTKPFSPEALLQKVQQLLRT